MKGSLSLLTPPTHAPPAAARRSPNGRAAAHLIAALGLLTGCSGAGASAVVADASPADSSSRGDVAVRDSGGRDSASAADVVARDVATSDSSVVDSGSPDVAPADTGTADVVTPADTGAGDVVTPVDAGCAAHGCPAGTWCAPSGACLAGCTTDTDCRTGDAGSAVTCDVTTHSCVGCVTASDCPAVGNATVSCDAGACAVASCATGYADCDHLEANGCEENIARDANNCGACGQVCSLAHAAAGCSAGQCTVSACAAGWADCDSVASNGCEANLASLEHCGTCTNACTAAANAVAECSAGTCVPFAACQAGYADCDNDPSDGCEVDTATDPGHCGSCSYACAAIPDGTVGCSAGSCSVASCDPGYADCDHTVYDGCEVDLANDAENCTACDDACPAVANGAPACVAGVCGKGSCDGNYADCDNDPSDGCEINLLNDVVNCGACGVPCADVPNGSPVCTNGACGVGSCNPGFADCDHTGISGCETDLTSDVNDCGACGTVCPNVANGTRACQAGTCAVGSCDTGFRDCDSDPSDGCEVDVSTDPGNCGSCGDACSFPNAVAGCSNRSCTIASCQAGYANCDGNATNGCETATASSATDCGGCGIVCGSGVCSGGQCTCIKNVLLLVDDSASGATALATAITSAGYSVTQSTLPSYDYAGTPSLSGYGAVVVLAGGSDSAYTTDMPLAGQQAIASFVAAGNGLVLTEWAAYQVAQGHWATLAPYVLLQRSGSFTGQVTYTVDTGWASSGLWKGLPASFTFASTSNVGLTQAAQGVTRIAGSSQALDAVAIMDTGVGRVLHLAHAGDYARNGWSNANVQQLMVNAVGWAARCF